MERLLLIGLTNDKKKLAEYIKGDIVMKAFEDTLNEKNQDKDLMESYDKEWAIEDLGIQKGIEKGKELGLAEGLAEGKELGLVEGKELGLVEGKINLAKKMLKDMPIEKVSEYTELSIEELEKIKRAE